MTMQRWLVFLVVVFAIAYLVRNLRRTSQDSSGCAACDRKRSCRKAAENKGPCGSYAKRK